jgi:hypothetical protein
MALARIQIPEHVFGITPPGSRRQRFTTETNEERIRLGREDQKAKLAIRSLQREKAGPRFHKEMERGEGLVRLRDFFLGELAVQENTELSGGVNSSDERCNHGGMEVNLERKKYETVKALRTFM